jgi:hypothetical protein
VSLCGARGDHQLCGDCLVGEAFCDEIGDLPFTAKKIVATKVPAVSKASAATTTKDIREWAIGEGREVSPRGRISAEIEQAFHDAQATKAQAKAAPAKKAAAKKIVAGRAPARKRPRGSLRRKRQGRRRRLRRRRPRRFESGRSGRAVKCPCAVGFRPQSCVPSITLRRSCRLWAAESSGVRS